MNATELANAIAASQAEANKTLAESITAGMKGMVSEMVSEMVKTLAENSPTPNVLEGDEELKVATLEDVVKGTDTVTPSGAVRNEPGIKFARFIKASAIAQQNRKSQDGPTDVVAVIEKQYAFDKSFVAEVKQISVGNDGGFLIHEDYANEVIQLLYADTVAVALGARIVPMPKGNLNLPKLVSGSSAGYIGENKAKNASRPKYSNVKLTSKKLANVVPISNDILRSTTYSSDMFVRDDMMTQMRLAMDAAVLFGPGTEYSPRGIANTNGVQKVTVGALPTTENTFAQVTAIMGVNSLFLKPGWAWNSVMHGVLYNLKDGNGRYIHRTEIQAGKFHGFPYKISNQITTASDAKKTTQLFFGDWAEVIIGEQMTFEMKLSEEASYTDEDGESVSAFALDQSVLRALMEHDVAIPRAQAMTVYTYNTIA